MPILSCSEHAGVSAVFGCDACGRLLCEECVEEGHRLFFCRPCGERAMPLERHTPAVTTDRRQSRARATAATYGWSQALLYPLRGRGAFVLFGYLALLSVFILIESIVLLGACITTVPRLAIGMLIAPFLLAIAHSTAAGENELPEWPEFEPWSLFLRSLRVLAVAVFSLLPTLALLWLAGGASALAGGPDPGQLLVLLVLQTIGLVLSMAVWLLSFGATAVYDTPWLFFRADLHWRAARVAGSDLLIATLLCGALLAVTPLLWLVLTLAIPFAALAELTTTAVSIYATLLSAHIAGIVFRRHADSMEAIYLG